MPEQALAALRELMLMVQPPDDDLANHHAPVEPGLVERLPDGKPYPNPPAPVEPVAPVDLDALLSPAGAYETGPDAARATQLQEAWGDMAPADAVAGLAQLADKLREETGRPAPPADHIPGPTKMPNPPAEGEVGLTTFALTTMPELSPAAQAVMDAYHAAPIVGIFPRDGDQLGVAAALRAVARQPYEVRADIRGDDYCHYCAGVEAERNRNLAIAAELEGQPSPNPQPNPSQTYD